MFTDNFIMGKPRLLKSYLERNRRLGHMSKKRDMDVQNGKEYTIVKRET